MNKNVQDESWWVDQGSPDVVLRSSSGSEASFGGRLAPEFDLERARLASQAPTMARLLLRIRERTGHCPWCSSEQGSDHEPHCELSEVLRRAGVVR